MTNSAVQPDDVHGVEAHRSNAERLQRRLDRERRARGEAERLLEEKSLALYSANEELKRFVDELERRVLTRTEELQQALSRAEAATQHKSLFLAKMSHEIRTPLNGLLGMAQLLASSSLSSQQQVWARALITSGGMLMGVVNDVLDFSKVEAGKLQLESHVFETRDCFEMVLNLYRPLVERKSIALNLDWGDGLPKYIRADSARLRQVLSNLISNAIKFTHSGAITVRVLARTNKLGHFPLRVEVHDTGLGIALEDQSRLFRVFSQADQSTSRRFGGTGLGLAICAQLVEAMQGEIQVKSLPGQGSVFSFSILVEDYDVDPKDLSFAEDEPAVEPLLGLENLRVLAAEDNEINRLLLDEVLKDQVRDLKFAVDGADAIRMVGQFTFDVILMDVQMPNVDGLQATKVIRNLPLRSQPKIIGLTANAFKEDREECLAAGMDEFVSKPLEILALKKVLASMK